MKTFRSTSHLLFFYLMLISVSTQVFAGNLIFGTQGHDRWTTSTWLSFNEEKAFQVLARNNLRIYGVDVRNDAASYAVLTRLIILGKKYNVQIRPMYDVSSGSQNDAYQIAKIFASDIHFWVLGNELGLQGVSNFQSNIKLMLAARAGIIQAASETGQPLTTGINVTATWNDTGLNPTTNRYTFLDTAVAMGLQFDVITYHYYPDGIDRSQGWMKRYLDPLRAYGKSVVLTETNCALIYKGDDGNSTACTQAVNDILTVIQDNYGDLFNEASAYEIIDDPAIVGSEGHFGIMYNLSSPKQTLAVLSQHALGSAAVMQPIVANTSNLSNNDFVAELFAAALNRVPDNTGWTYWTNWLNVQPNKAAARASLVVAFVQGAEFTNNASKMDNQAFVARLYLALLGRRVDMPALATYGAALDKKTMSQGQVIQTLLTLPEFKNRKN